MTKKIIKKKQEEPIKIVYPNNFIKFLHANDSKTIAIFSIIILVIGFLLYARTIGYDLVYFDDDRLIVHVKDFNQDISNIKETFKQTVGATYYRPILAISFILDAQIAGIETWIYRLTNLLYHILASMLVYIALTKLKMPNPYAFFLGLFVVVHPILTPAAVWISGRNDSLITIFLMLSFITLVGFLESKSPRNWIYLILHALTFALSLYTKESAAFFPFISILYIVLIRKEKIFKTNNYLLGAIWFIIGLIWFSMRSKAVGTGPSPDSIGFESLITNIPAIFALIGKIFLPIRLSAVANYDTFSIVSGIVFLAAFFFLLFYLKNLNKKVVLFGVIWFILMLLPTLMVRIKIDYFDYAEHRVFMPMFGILIILYEIIKTLKIDFKKIIPIVVASVIILTLAGRSFSYERAFSSGMAFWTHFVKKYPENPMGNFNRAEILFFKNAHDKADEFYMNSLKYDNLQKTYVGNFIAMTFPSLVPPNDKNDIDYKRSLNPEAFNYISLHNYLASRYLIKGYPQNAQKIALQCVKQYPYDPLANYNLGKSYIDMGNFAQAIPALENAVALNGRDFQWFADLGNCYFNTNNFEMAEKAYISALNRNPASSIVTLNLGSVYSYMGRKQEGIQLFEKAVQLDPNLIAAYNNLITFYCTFDKNREKAYYYYNIMKQRGFQIPPDVEQLIKKTYN